ncbi:MAG TPA: DegQ family serine endoprotease [Stellaceae bacterium]|nr:DegQ family serine endoprotease [Stellaceae bacterium]
MGSGFLLRLLAAGLLLLGPAEAETRVVPSSEGALKLSYAPIVKKTAPAVVNVYSRRVVRAQSPLAVDPFFRRFFGDAQPFGLPRQRIQNSLGSGVILDAGGLIVTNHHVVKDADEVTVVLADRREFDARILITDQRTDLAVLKIEVKGERLPTLEIADSDTLEVGDIVLAIGDPFGVGQTVTSGIISGLARTGVGIADFRSFIQTDAPINPGNSGGALVDLDGRLVGINTAIFSQSGGSIGIGFAIPSALVRPILRAAAHGGVIERPWLGVAGQPVTAELAQALGLPRPGGVLVKEVAPQSPAAKGGVNVGDVIMEFDGHEIEDPEGLRFRVATLPLDQTAHLTLLRSGKRRIAMVVLTRPPEDPPRQRTELQGRHPLAGAVVGNLNPAFDEELGLETTTRGVVVSEIRNNTPSARLGLQPGDIVWSLNGHMIEDVAELQRLVKASLPWALSVKRGAEVLSVTVR